MDKDFSFSEDNDSEVGDIDDAESYNEDQENGKDEHSVNGEQEKSEPKRLSKLQAVNKTSKYKSALHGPDIRKIKNKEKKDRRERAKVKLCSYLCSFFLN